MQKKKKTTQNYCQSALQGGAERNILSLLPGNPTFGPHQSHMDAVQYTTAHW